MDWFMSMYAYTCSVSEWRILKNGIDKNAVCVVLVKDTVDAIL